MSLTTAHFSRSRDGVDRLKEHLASCAREITDVRVFAAEFARAVTELLDAHSVRVWQGSAADQLIEIGPNDRAESDSTTNPIDLPSHELPSHELIARVLEQRMTYVSPRQNNVQIGSPAPTSASTFWILAPIVGVTSVHGLVYCELSTENTSENQSTVCRLLQSTIDVSLPFFESQVALQVLRDRDLDRLLQDFSREVHFEPSISATSATIAVEFQRLFQSDRTWLLMPSAIRWRVKAVGGIPGFQRRANVVRKLEKLVSLVARTKQPFKWSAGVLADSLAPRVRKALDQYLDEVHVSNLRIEPLTICHPAARNLRHGDSARTTMIGIVVCEWFQPPNVSYSESCWTAAGQQSALALQNASDWSRAPIARLLRNWRRTVAWRFFAGWGTAIAVALVAAVFAALTPIDFTIDAVGELQPVRQRHVFATSAGIVRTLSVSSGSKVSEGALLLELDSPELELEIRRTEGDLQTTEKRITAIEASRLDFGLSSPDSSSQMNSLAGDLKEQRQKRDNLRRELELLSQRGNDLRVVSPIEGRVVTWDLERLLSRRPVTRGQRLLTVSDTGGPWELELRVTDDDTDDLYTARIKNESVAVDFITVTMPERVHSTKLRSVSETVEIRSPGEAPSLLCLADVPENMIDSAVEGMSVRGRIHCGRRAAIAVLFHKVWRSIREHVLFPCGW